MTVKHNFIANLTANVWLLLLWVVVVPLYAGLMGMEAFGLVGLFVAIQAVAAQLDMGLSMTLNRELARRAPDSHHLVRTLEVIYWAVAVFIGIAVVASSGVIATRWVHAQEMSAQNVKQAIVLMGLALALQWPLALYAGGLMGIQRQVLLNVINIIMYTVRFAGAVVVLKYVDATIQAFFLWQAITGLLHVGAVALALWLFLPKAEERAGFRKQSLFGVWRFAAGLWGISLLSMFLMQSDKIVLSKWLSLKTFGYYSLAALAAGTLYRLFQSLFNAIYPRFSQLASDRNGAELRLLYHRGCQTLSVPTTVIAVVTALFPREVLFVWTNDPETAQRAAVVLALLVGGTALNGLLQVPAALQLAYGWTSLALCVNAVGIVLYLPIMVWLAYTYGMVGAAAAWVVLNLVYLFVFPILTHRRLLRGANLSYYVGDTLTPLVTALCVLVPLRFWLPSDMDRWKTAGIIGATAVVALALAAFAAPEMRRMIMEFLRGKNRSDKCASA